MSPYFLYTEITPPDPEKALFHLIPVPLEKTVSFASGTAMAPEIILDVSGQLELTDSMYGEPWLQGIYTHPAVQTDGTTEQVMGRISTLTGQIATSGKIPVTIGGEHTVTYGAVSGVKRHYPDMGVINFDAHADFRDTYEGNRFSHACVMKRIFDDSTPIVQIANRALCKDETDFIAAHDIPCFPAHKIVPGAVSNIVIPADFPQHVYISIDIDSLDPSIAPATGTPVPGGLPYYQLFALIEACLKDRRLVGFDLVEHAPIKGLHACDYLCADIIYKMMGVATKFRRLKSVASTLSQHSV